MPSKVYVHYGDSFGTIGYSDKMLMLNDISNKSLNMGNQGWPKPIHGCFWGSPKRSPRSWKAWCKNNMDYPDSYWAQSMTFRVPINRIATVSDRISYLYYKSKYGSNDEYGTLDFDTLRDDGYFGVEVLISKWPPLYHLMYGWDCDSICIWDERAILPTKHQPQNIPGILWQ